MAVGPAPQPVGKEPDQLTVGLIQLVEHLKPLLECVEVVPDGGRLGPSETANELIGKMESIGYKNRTPRTGRGAELGLPHKLVNTAELGCQQQQNRALLLFEPANLKGASGPLRELRTIPGRDPTLGDALCPLEEVPEASYSEGRFVPYEQPDTDSATYPLIAGHLYTEAATVGVGVGSEVTLKGIEATKKSAKAKTCRWLVVATQGEHKLEVVCKKMGPQAGEQHRVVGRDMVETHLVRRLEVWHPRGVGMAPRATWRLTGAGPPLVLENRGTRPRARRLSVLELPRLAGLTKQELEWFEELRAEETGKRNKGESGLEALVAAGRATPTPLAESMIARVAERLQLMQQRLCLLPSVVDGEGYLIYERAAKLGGDLEGHVQRESGNVEHTSKTIKPYCAQKVGALVADGEGNMPTTRASGGKRVGLGGRPMVGTGTGAAEILNQAAAFLVANSVNDSAQTTYERS